VRTALPVDLPLSLGPLACGRWDPTIRADGGAWWRATRTATGPATVRYAPADGGVRVRAWGPGAEAALALAPDLLGARDELDGFDPGAGLVHELHRRFSGLRVIRSRAVFQAIVPAVLEQQVTGKESRASWRRLVLRYGEPAPGPLAGLMLPPAAATLAALPYHAFHPLGVEMRRANTVRGVAAGAARLEATAAMPLADAHRRLRAFPGVGPWTAAVVAGVALGDGDAVPVGDYHVKHMVSWALAGEPRGTDERMLELLEPFAGHRGRVVRLIKAAGLAAPRFGPRMPARSYERL